MALMNRRSMDPRWVYASRKVPSGFMEATIEIFRPAPQNSEPVFDPETGTWSGGPVTYLFRGRARVQPNKDWRARNREFAREETAEHAVRVQVEFGSNTIEGSDGVLPEFRLGDRIRVTSSPHDTALEDYIFTVRNPTSSSNAWLRNLLCDVDLGASNVGEP
jgi:hypothetical protein